MEEQKFKCRNHVSCTISVPVSDWLELQEYSRKLGIPVSRIIRPSIEKLVEQLRNRFNETKENKNDLENLNKNITLNIMENVDKYDLDSRSLLYAKPQIDDEKWRTRLYFAGLKEELISRPERKNDKVWLNAHIKELQKYGEKGRQFLTNELKIPDEQIS